MITSKNLRENQPLQSSTLGGFVGTRKRRLPPADKNKGYKQQYGVIIICKDEREQVRVYNRLLQQKFTVRVVVT